MNINILGISELKWTGMGEFNSGEHCIQRRQWHPTPVLLPGKSHGWRSLVGCHLWGCTELDTTEVTWWQRRNIVSTTVGKNPLEEMEYAS